MVKAARKLVVVCDSTKFNRQSLALIVAPHEIDTVITDTSLSNRDRDLLESAGIEVQLV
jgi:DeoR family transcriptional regulator of aga operon